MWWNPAGKIEMLSSYISNLIAWGHVVNQRCPDHGISQGRDFCFNPGYTFPTGAQFEVAFRNVGSKEAAVFRLTEHLVNDNIESGEILKHLDKKQGRKKLQRCYF